MLLSNKCTVSPLLELEAWCAATTFPDNYLKRIKLQISAPWPDTQKMKSLFENIEIILNLSLLSNMQTCFIEANISKPWQLKLNMFTPVISMEEVSVCLSQTEKKIQNCLNVAVMRYLKESTAHKEQQKYKITSQKNAHSTACISKRIFPCLGLGP